MTSFATKSPRTMFRIVGETIRSASGQIVLSSTSQAWLEFACDALEEKFERNTQRAQDQLDNSALTDALAAARLKIHSLEEEIVRLQLELGVETNKSKRLLSIGLTEVAVDEESSNVKERVRRLSSLFNDIFKEKVMADGREVQVIKERDQAIDSVKNLVKSLQELEEKYNYLLKTHLDSADNSK